MNDVTTPVITSKRNRENDGEDGVMLLETLLGNKRQAAARECDADNAFLDSIFLQPADLMFQSNDSMTPMKGDLPRLPLSPSRVSSTARVEITKSPLRTTVPPITSHTSSPDHMFEPVIAPIIAGPPLRGEVPERDREWLQKNVIGVVEKKSVSSLARVQMNALRARRDAALKFVYDENDELSGATCDGHFFDMEELQKNSIF
jgi:hypothetical protein